MKVLHLIGSLDPGGAETLLIDIAARERSAGHDHSIAHLGNEWLAAEAERRGVPATLLPAARLYWSNATAFAWSALLARTIRARRPDAVHAHLYGMAICGALASRLARTPCVATIHDRYYLDEKRRRGWLLRRVAGGAAIVAVSEDVARTIQRTSGLAARVIPNGVDTSAIRPDPQARREVRGELGAGDSPVIISVGRLEPVKRHDLLLEAVRRVRDGGLTAQLWIAGDGSQRGAIEALVRTLGMGDCVRVLGHRGDTHRLLAGADLFLLTSDSEGMPVALIEAMSAGLPCVARAVGGVPEVIADGVTGLLARTDDPAALAGRAREGLAPEMAARLGAAARSRAVERFSIERMIASYRDLYAERAPGTRAIERESGGVKMRAASLDKKA